jgi:osmotically-inducible protein OsmY
MNPDAQLRGDVVAELTWDPMITATNIGVIVKDGVVTLTGHPSSHAEKHAIERAVQRVKGVKGVAIELNVKLAAGYERTDADIAAAAERALEWNVLVPDDKVHPMVENGWVTLNGEVEWEYQGRAAEAAVRNLLGVTGITNQVVVKPKFTPGDIEKNIHDALLRQAEREAREIEVSVQGAQVMLNGKVRSFAERKAVQAAAWSAPGVASVTNNLRIET